MRKISVNDEFIEHFKLTDRKNVANYAASDSEILFEEHVNLLNEDAVKSKTKIDLARDFYEDYTVENNDAENENYLQCLKEAYETGKLKNHQIDVVCYNRMLVRLCLLQHQRSFDTPDRYAVIKLDGCLFFCWFRVVSDDVDEDQAKGIFCDRRFAKLMTVTDERTDVDLLLTKKKYANFITQLKSRNCTLNIYLTSYVDCEDRDGNFVDLVTRRMGRTGPLDVSTRRFNILKWWAQSYFTGVDRLIVGYKNPEFEIVQIDEMKPSELPKLAYQNRTQLWSSTKCVNFVGYFFKEVKQFMEDFDENDICTADINPATLTIEFNRTRKEEKPDLYFIPDWFVQFWRNRT